MPGDVARRVFLHVSVEANRKGQLLYGYGLRVKDVGREPLVYHEESKTCQPRSPR
jgi:hypothetical protein